MAVETVLSDAAQQGDLANSLGIEIEITPRPPSAKPKPVPVPTAKRVPHAKSGWDYFWGGLLVVGAGVIIVA